MKAKYIFATVRILKGFAAGIVCRAQVWKEDGETYYICSPHSFRTYYTPDYVEVIKEA